MQDGELQWGGFEKFTAFRNVSGKLEDEARDGFEAFVVDFDVEEVFYFADGGSAVAYHFIGGFVDGLLVFFAIVLNGANDLLRKIFDGLVARSLES